MVKYWKLPRSNEWRNLTPQKCLDRNWQSEILKTIVQWIVRVTWHHDFCAFQRFLSWKNHFCTQTFQNRKKTHLKSCAIDDNLNPFAVNLHFSLEFFHSSWNQTKKEINLIAISRDSNPINFLLFFSKKSNPIYQKCKISSSKNFFHSGRYVIKIRMQNRFFLATAQCRGSNECERKSIIHGDLRCTA